MNDAFFMATPRPTSLKKIRSRSTSAKSNVSYPTSSERNSTQSSRRPSTQQGTSSRRRSTEPPGSPRRPRTSSMSQRIHLLESQEASRRSTFLNSVEYNARGSPQHTQTSATVSTSQKKKVNYRDELTYFFYAELISYVITSWDHVEEPHKEDSDEELQRAHPSEESTAIATTSITSPLKSHEPDEEKTTTMEASHTGSHTTTTVTTSIHETTSKSSRSSRLSNSQRQRSDRGSSVLPAIEEVAKLHEARSFQPTSSSETSSFMTVLSWFAEDERDYVEINFRSGDYYKGHVYRKMMDGNGVFRWADGSVYVGEFKQGAPHGRGTFTYNDLSTYSGDFAYGHMTGKGSFFPSTISRCQYVGNWFNSQFSGKGWLSYYDGGHYEGDFANGLKHGEGYQQYATGTIYSGGWIEGKQHGFGLMHYCNNDFYRGDWIGGEPHGYGEYTWNSSLIRGLVLTMENIYQGSWHEGKRHGLGLLHFGMDGSKLASLFRENIKHGAGIIVCGDGTIIERNPLFWYDSPVHQQVLHSLPSSGQSRPKSMLQQMRNDKRRKSSRSRNVIFSKVSISSRLNESFPTVCVKEKPLEIPIHGTPLEMSLVEHVRKVVELEIERFSSDAHDQRSISLWNLYRLSRVSNEYDTNTQVNLIRSPITIEHEEEKLRKVVVSNYNYLEGLYNQYALIASPCEDISIKPVMCRLFLWQFYRDIKIKIPLYEIDEMLCENQHFSMESEHYPFEKIYFWQFIHSLLTVTHRIFYSEQLASEYHDIGICAKMFTMLITDYIKPNAGSYIGKALFRYRNVAPITNVFAFYGSLGERLSARKLLRTCCNYAPFLHHENHAECDAMLTKPVERGVNSVCTGTNILYLVQEAPIPERYQHQIAHAYPFDKAAKCEGLRAFKPLGAQKIMRCITTVCPMIVSDDLIVNIDYQLTFLEFYEVLLLLAEELFKQKMTLAERKLAGISVTPTSQNLLAKRARRRSMKPNSR